MPITVRRGNRIVFSGGLRSRQIVAGTLTVEEETAGPSAETVLICYLAAYERYCGQIFIAALAA
jgi:hypothetical protein